MFEIDDDKENLKRNGLTMRNAKPSRIEDFSCDIGNCVRSGERLERSALFKSERRRTRVSVIYLAIVRDAVGRDLR